MVQITMSGRGWAIGSGPIDETEGRNKMQKEQELTPQTMIGNLIRVGHKSLAEYIPDGLKVVRQDPNLFAHIIAWDRKNGEIRDTKKAYPMISLRGIPGDENMYYENAVAHLMLLDPRNLVMAIRFHSLIEGHQFKPGAKALLDFGVERYLRIREQNVQWWDKTALQHRDSMKTLYAMFHIKPFLRAQKVLFDRQYPKNSVFEVLKNLKIMGPKEAAGTIMNYKIPFLMAIGALNGGASKNTDVLLAMVESMTASELITNTSMLTKMGVMLNPVLKSAYDKGLQKIYTDKRVSSLKVGKAASVITDKKTKAKLEKVQEDKLDSLAGLEGDWLVLGDMSGSMEYSIEKAREVAAFLSRAVKGKVYLVFFREFPYAFEVTSGKTLEEIKKATRGVSAGGQTCIGCGLQLMLEKGIIVNGIAIVSDGGENRTPLFTNVYKEYEKKMGISPNVYFLHVPGDTDGFSHGMEMMGVPFTKLDISNVDFYGLPNLLKIMRTSKYSLLSDIMDTPLLTIAEVLKGGE